MSESEHKAVAFDVYRSIGGSERLRIWTMRILRHGLLLGLALQVLVTLSRDPASRERGRVRHGWRGMRRSELFRKETWQGLKDFERPDFHPDDRDTDALLEEWRERLFGAGGALNDRLLGGAAA